MAKWPAPVPVRMMLYHTGQQTLSGTVNRPEGGRMLLVDPRDFILGTLLQPSIPLVLLNFSIFFKCCFGFGVSFLFICFETRSHYVTLAGLKFRCPPSPPLGYWG